MLVSGSFAKTLRAFSEKQQLDRLKPPLPAATEVAEKKPAKPAKSPLTRGMPIAKTAPEEPAGGPQFSEILGEKKRSPHPLGNGLLSRAWSWLQKGNAFSASKQLRVSETVSLGEKRFVALVHVEGQKFLIGGGASGVSLLTHLGEWNASPDALQAIEAVAERSK